MPWVEGTDDTVPCVGGGYARPHIVRMLSEVVGTGGETLQALWCNALCLLTH